MAAPGEIVGDDDLLATVDAQEKRKEEEAMRTLSRPVAQLNIAATDQWKHSAPRVRFAMLREQLNQRQPPPTILFTNRPGGFAIFQSAPDERDWWEIEIRDSPVIHWVPSLHIDYMKLTIKMPLPAHRVQDVLSISRSISYEPTTDRLSAMCHTMLANVATLALVADVVDGVIDPVEARREYGPRIKSTFHPQHGLEAYTSFLAKIGLYEGDSPPALFVDSVDTWKRWYD